MFFCIHCNSETTLQFKKEYESFKKIYHAAAISDQIVCNYGNSIMNNFCNYFTG